MMRILALIAIGFFTVTSKMAPAVAEDAARYDVPLFRQVDPVKKPPSTEGLKTLRLLTDEDFPPFSFRDANGTMTGLNVELALGACSELAISCEIVALPWSGLKPALESRQGSAIISGIRMTDKSAEGLDTTRPFFRALGRFATRAQSDITEIGPTTINGKKIGVVSGSGHAAWVAQHFTKSETVAYGTTAQVREALKAGQVDLVFGDALELVYWVAGEDSQRCCKLVPGAFVDTAFFSNPMFYVVRRGDTPLRQALDYGLDRMQTTGRFAEIFRRYVPLNPW